jgi:O-antigen/teichoic acid export membrane protein
MKFLKHLSLYTSVGVIGAGINFFIMPVLSHYLSPADYGLLALFNTYITILLPIVSVSAYSLLSVDYFKQRNKKTFASEFTSIQLIPLFNAVLLSVTVWLFYGKIAESLELKGTGIKWGFNIVVLTLLNIYYDQFIQFLILQKKARAFAIYSLAKIIIEISLTFYFVVGNRLGWEGRMYSWLIVSILFFIIAFIYFKKEGFIKWQINRGYILQGVKFGSPLILHGIGKFVVNQSDRLFIAKMVSLDQAGIYNIGYTVGSLVMIGVSAFFNFYTPYLMERMSDLTEEKRLQIVKMSYLFIFGCIAILVFILVLTPVFFNYFIDPRYGEGASYVFWVALGYCFWGGYMLFSGFIFYLKKSNILGWLAIFNVVSNLLFNYYFILLFGAIGAAYATALSFFLLMIVIGYVANKLLPMPWYSFKKLRAISLS